MTHLYPRLIDFDSIGLAVFGAPKSSSSSSGSSANSSSNSSSGMSWVEARQAMTQDSAYTNSSSSSSNISIDVESGSNERKSSSSNSESAITSSHKNDEDGINTSQLDKNKVYVIARDLDDPNAKFVEEQHSATLYFDEKSQSWETIGGYDKGGYLTGENNHPGDSPSVEGMIVVATIETSLSPQDYVNKIEGITDRYGNDAPYSAAPVVAAWAPKESLYGHNCNSFTAGLHEAAGGTVVNYKEENVQDLVGFSQPLKLN